MVHKLDEVELHYSDVETRLTSPEVVNNTQLFQKLSKEHANLQPLVETYRIFRKVKNRFAENKEIIDQDAGELKDLATEENKQLETELEQLERKLKVLLLPKDPNDDKNTMVEIRPAAGGDEAGIFAGDLYRMYSKFAEKRRWQVELMEATPNDVGGYKEIILMIRGDKVYSVLKYESGVHRVQRVPKTETQGRIHTSTVTVAVLPEAEDVEVDINPNDYESMFLEVRVPEARA